MNLSFEGKRAVVCGSTQGIAKAAAIQMAELGASITLVARSQEKLDAVKAELPVVNGAEHHTIAADFSDPKGLESKIKDYLASYSGNVDILVNNTGGPKGGPANAAPLDEFYSAFDMHLACNHVMVTTLLDRLKSADYGRIINVISTSVKQPLPNLGVSNTIRGAVANWSKTLANELGQFNITVNNVLPGATDTARLKSIISNKANQTGASEDDVKQGMANQVPMKRVAQPEEVASAITFLASPAASYINGINVPVDGGRTACL